MNRREDLYQLLLSQSGPSMAVSLAQSLDGSTMETSKEQTKRLGLQFSSTDQIPTISHEKEESFDWD